MLEQKLTHIDANGNAIMVDVGEKVSTGRTAVATGTITLHPTAFAMVQAGTAKKGDVLGVAKIAGIMATKKTADLIPLCHHLNLTHSSVTFQLDADTHAIQVFCKVSCQGQTGVEMEALTGVNVALLTIYDMCKAVDKSMVISQIHLVEKQGGKSGDFYFQEPGHGG